MTEREFNRKMEKLYPRAESVRLGREAYRYGFEKAYGAMDDSTKAFMEKQIANIK